MTMFCIIFFYSRPEFRVATGPLHWALHPLTSSPPRSTTRISTVTATTAARAQSPSWLRQQQRRLLCTLASPTKSQGTDRATLQKELNSKQCQFFSSEYTVNAMDADELRRSQRKMKKSRIGANAVASQESDDLDLDDDEEDEEEDEASTPTAEREDKSAMSMLSIR